MSIGSAQQQHFAGHLLLALRRRRRALACAAQVAGVHDGAAGQLAMQLRAPEDVPSRVHRQRERAQRERLSPPGGQRSCLAQRPRLGGIEKGDRRRSG